MALWIVFGAHQHVQILLCPRMQMTCLLTSPGLPCAPSRWTESPSCWPRWTGEGSWRRAGETGAVISAWRESARWNSVSVCMAARTMILGTITAWWPHGYGLPPVCGSGNLPSKPNPSSYLWKWMVRDYSVCCGIFSTLLCFSVANVLYVCF